jgi:phage terminase large subunit-like protein
VNGSLAASLASRPATERAAILAGLSADELLAFEYDWRSWARPNQLAPAGDWTVWMRMAGRGEGKTRSGAEWVRDQLETGNAARVALVAPTAADARDVMVEGESGILAISPDWNRPLYEPSKRRLTWPNGAIATLYSADEPERLRGPQHDAAWADELGAWRYPEAWDQLMFGLRLGQRPRVVVTTTPKPTKLIRDLLSRPDCIVSRGKTSDNKANLAPAFLDTVVRRYQGTRLGRQELEGELLDDVPGALWTRGLIEQNRITTAALPTFSRVVVAIDPAVSSDEDSDETGIVVCGLANGTGYVLDDRSGRYAPHEWARRAVDAYRHHKGDRIVAEVNNGGDMVESTLRMVDRSAPYRAVHASRGKRVRAEPVSALYEQGRVKHVGAFPELEDQMCNWVPDSADASPDRMDALVWCLTELIVDAPAPPSVRLLG